MRDMGRGRRDRGRGRIQKRYERGEMGEGDMTTLILNSEEGRKD